MVKDLIKMYAITAYTIFQKCFENAELLNNGELKREYWPKILTGKLENKFKEEYENEIVYWVSYPGYLRDRYNEILKFMQEGNPKRIMGFSEYKFKPLLKYAGKEDYTALDKSFDSTPVFDKTKPDDPEVEIIQTNTPVIEPVSISVLYSPQTLGRFDILRNPDNGFLYFYPNGDFIFEGDISLYIRRAAYKKAIRHSMYGDNNLWVKVDYERDRKIQTAYFAEIKAEAGILKLSEPDEILKYLDKRDD